MHQTSKHRSWFKCTCGHTFRSVTHRRRGQRKCPSCLLVAEHRTILPPAASGPAETAVNQAESSLLTAALELATHHASRGYSSGLRPALDELLYRADQYRIAVHQRDQPAQPSRMTQTR